MTELTIYEYDPRIKGFKIRATVFDNVDFEVEMGQTVYKISRVNMGDHVFISVYLTPLGIKVPAHKLGFFQRLGL